jgi:hypothetical protein
MQTQTASISQGIQKRNPTVMLAIGWGAPYVGGPVLGTILASITGFGLFATILWLAGSIVAGHLLKKMVEELKALTNDTSVNPVLMYVPGLNQIFCFLHVHGIMERARAQRGLRSPAKAKWMYLILPWYALAADLNDLA